MDARRATQEEDRMGNMNAWTNRLDAVPQVGRMVEIDTPWGIKDAEAVKSRQPVELQGVGGDVAYRIGTLTLNASLASRWRYRDTPPAEQVVYAIEGKGGGMSAERAAITDDLLKLLDLCRVADPNCNIVKITRRVTETREVAERVPKCN